MKVFEQELIKQYEQQPVIVVLDDDQREQLEKILLRNKMRYQASSQ